MGTGEKMERVHELKTLAQYWDAIESGEKTFEVRRNDRGFQTGDIVSLQRMTSQFPHLYDSSVEPLRFRIGWILQGGQFGIESGYCVFSLASLTQDPARDV